MNPPEVFRDIGTHLANLEVDHDCLDSYVLLDVSAAFDTVIHNILLSRLQNYIGIEDTALAWCKSYLYNRTQHVYIGTV